MVRTVRVLRTNGTLPCTHVVQIYNIKRLVSTYNMISKQLLIEIQALRCNGETRGRCQHKRNHSILQFQRDSDVCSARISTTILDSMWACTRHGRQLPLPLASLGPGPHPPRRRDTTEVPTHVRELPVGAGV
jgi:hypothetical protein